MEYQYEQDNMIQWIFEKAYNQLTLNNKEMFDVPFFKIKKKTFDNFILYNLINKLTGKNINTIENYLKNVRFQEKFIFEKLKKKINVQILLGNFDKIKCLISKGYKFDNLSLQLAILNNQLEIIVYIMKNNHVKIDNKMLMYCVENAYDDIYFFLRSKNYFPNISIFNKAAFGNSLSILKDINENVGISNKILTNIFKTNNNGIIIYALEQSKKENIKFDKNLVTYPILNNNMIILKYLENLELIDWHVELYNCAMLSGDVNMILYLESKIPNLHNNHILDQSKISKGHSSLLLEDIIYEKNNKKYFSHSMNYAVQSGSLDVVKYIHSKGYGITPSNFLTCIKQGDVSILEYLCQNYDKKLPFYYLHYFGINSYIADKMKKIKMLVCYELFDINLRTNLTINDYQKESIHLKMIAETYYVFEDNMFDTDFLMNYQLFFTPIKGYKLNDRLIAITRIKLELDLIDELKELYSKIKTEVDKKYMIDTIYLFGTFHQITTFFKDSLISYIPNICIIMELICYGQINKLCFIFYKNAEIKMIIDQIYPIITMLSDDIIYTFFQNIYNFQPQFKHIVYSENKKKIIEWIDNHTPQNYLNLKLIKKILILDDLRIVKKLNFENVNLQELINWAEECDLLEIVEYLKTIIK